MQQSVSTSTEANRPTVSTGPGSLLITSMRLQTVQVPRESKSSLPIWTVRHSENRKTVNVDGLIVGTGDGKDDFVIVDPKTGGLTLYKSGGQQSDGKWGWDPVEGQIATGLGLGRAVRLADMNGKLFQCWARACNVLTTCR